VPSGWSAPRPGRATVACLGAGRVVVSPGGRADTSRTHAWSLNGGNGGNGLVLRGDASGCRLLASMRYRIITTDPEKYDVELWAMHWHRPAEATPPSRTSTRTPSVPPGTSSRRDSSSSQRCSDASRWERSRRTRSGARCSPSPRAFTSSTDPGPRTRPHQHLVGDARPPYCALQQDPGSRGSTPLPVTSSPPNAQRRGKGGPETHPAGTRSALSVEGPRVNWSVPPAPAAAVLAGPEPRSRWSAPLDERP
jgi:hypothetical protein